MESYFRMLRLKFASVVLRTVVFYRKKKSLALLRVISVFLLALRYLKYLLDISVLLLLGNCSYYFSSLFSRTHKVKLELENYGNQSIS